jgi:hypothetical protein
MPGTVFRASWAKPSEIKLPRLFLSADKQGWECEFRGGFPPVQLFLGRL